MHNGTGGGAVSAKAFGILPILRAHKGFALQVVRTLRRVAATMRSLAIPTVISLRLLWPSVIGGGAISAKAFGILLRLRTQTGFALQVVRTRSRVAPTMRSWATLTATLVIEWKRRRSAPPVSDW